MRGDCSLCCNCSLSLFKFSFLNYHEYTYFYFFILDRLVRFIQFWFERQPCYLEWTIWHQQYCKLILDYKLSYKYNKQHIMNHLSISSLVPKLNFKNFLCGGIFFYKLYMRSTYLNRWSVKILKLHFVHRVWKYWNILPVPGQVIWKKLLVRTKSYLSWFFIIINIWYFQYTVAN